MPNQSMNRWPSFCYYLLILVLLILHLFTCSTHGLNAKQTAGVGLLPSRLLARRLEASAPHRARASTNHCLSHPTMDSTHHPSRHLMTFPSPAALRNQLQNITHPPSSLSIPPEDEVAIWRCLDQLYECIFVYRNETARASITAASLCTIWQVCNETTFNQAHQLHLALINSSIEEPLPSTQPLVIQTDFTELSANISLEELSSFVSQEPMMVPTPTWRGGFAQILHDLTAIQPIYPSKNFNRILQQLIENAAETTESVMIPKDTNATGSTSFDPTLIQLAHNISLFLDQPRTPDRNRSDEAAMSRYHQEAHLERFSPQYQQQLINRDRDLSSDYRDYFSDMTIRLFERFLRPETIKLINRDHSSHFRYFFSDLTIRLLERFLQPQTIEFVREFQVQRNPNRWYEKGICRSCGPRPPMQQFMKHLQWYANPPADWQIPEVSLPSLRPTVRAPVDL